VIEKNDKTMSNEFVHLKMTTRVASWVLFLRLQFCSFFLKLMFFLPQQKKGGRGRHKGDEREHKITMNIRQP
jgi:hypothetical protein